MFESLLSGHMAFIEQEVALAVKILVSATVSYKSARLNSALTVGKGDQSPGSLD